MITIMLILALALALGAITLLLFERASNKRCINGLADKVVELGEKCDRRGEKIKRLKRMIVKMHETHGKSLSRLREELRGERELTNHHLQQLTVKDRLLQQAYALLELVLEGDSENDTAPVVRRDRMRSLFVA